MATVNRLVTIPPVRAALRNRRLMRTIVAALAFGLAEWALWVGVLVYAYERGGARVAGFAALGLLVPSTLAAPIAGVLADGPRPERVLVLGYAAQALALVAAAIGAYMQAPAVVVIGATAVALAAVTFARPSTAVVVPGLVSTPAELTAANLLGGWCDSVSVLVGPLAAAVLIAVDDARSVFVLCATLCVAAAVATVPLGRARHVTTPVETERRARHALAELLGCIRGLAGRPSSLVLLIVLSGQWVLIGALDLVYVILAVDLLDIGTSGTGYLSASFGAGSVFGGLVATLLVARRRVAPVMVACLLVIALSMVLLGAVTSLALALVLLPLAGLSRALLDLTGRMLMQRVAPQHALASVFAALEALACLGMAAGSVLAQTLVAYSGERAALVGVGLFFAAMLLVTLSRIRTLDSSADVPVVAIRLLRSLPLFAPLGGAALEALGRAALTLEVKAGETIIAEGDPGDRYYAVVAGRFDVSRGDGQLRSLQRGEGFGEVALVADLPRTATVVAATDGTLLALERAPFLTAVTGHDVTSRAAWQIVAAYVPQRSAGDTA